jgi:putative transposase
MKRIWADAGIAAWVKDNFKVVLEIVLRCDDYRGFQVVAWRWVVERAFEWLGNYRRLSKDYEYFLENNESMIYLASIHRFLKRLALSR